MVKITMTARIGLESGRAILKNVLILLLPSMAAASYNSSGMLLSKKVLATITLNTATPPGSIRDQTLLSSPIFDTTR